MRLTHKKQYFHTNFVHFFEAVNYRTKKLKRLNRVLFTQIQFIGTQKKTKQSALHTNLINMASFFYYESYIELVLK